MGYVLFYLVCLLFYVSFAAPVIIGARGLGQIAELVWEHYQVVVNVIERRPGYQTIAPYRPQDELQPAHRQYFLGPAQRDLRQMLTLTGRRCTRLTRDRLRSVQLNYVEQQGEDAAYRVPFGWTLQLGIVGGAVLGAGLLALLVLVHGIVLALLSGTVLATAGALRAVDFVSLLAKRLHQGMVCPNAGCYQRVPYPVYECRRTACRRRHTDIRPGRYGILTRRCACGEELPTLILLMRTNRRLQPYCPFCENSMSVATGHMVETVLPLFGGRAAGKTQLMAALMLTLESSSAPGGRGMRTADDATQVNYEVLREVLQMQGHPRGTQVDLPRAYSVVVRRGRGERMVHIFDAAGERFVNREATDALSYVQAARTFLFVLDPLAVDAFWNGPALAADGTVDRSIASDVPPELVFQQAVQAMIQMAVPLKRSRLAVAVSKADLFAARTGSTGPSGLSGPGTDSDSAKEWLTDELGLGNLVRSMDLEFKEVRYFFTAGVTLDGQTVHPSVAPVVEWCLDHEEAP